MSENPYLPDDFDPEPSSANSQGVADRSGCLSPNLISAMFLFLTVVFLAYFAVMLVNPYLSINPFPPRTPLPVYVVATADPNLPTSTPSPTKALNETRLNTLAPTATSTQLPTSTALPTTTPAAVSPPSFPTATRQPPTATLVSGLVAGAGASGVFTPLPPVNPAEVTRSPYPFTVYEEGAVYVPNPNEQGCRWASIAGTVIDLNGAPVSGLAVHVVGEGIDEIRFTGTALPYGPSGYEVFLNGAPLSGQYVIQLLSQTGTPISAEFPLATSSVCEENVAVINFVQNHAY